MRKNHIFIQCASYRDPELRYTIQTALNNADHPNKISFGICWQGKLQELNSQLYRKGMSQCRTVLIDSDATKGIGYARYKAQAMYENEEFTLQIDSHMKFLPGWDTTCLDLLRECESPKPILTTYLTNHRNNEKPGCYRLAASEFDESGDIGITGKKIIRGDKPERGILCSAHFVFAKSEFFEQVPPDPEMQFLFEETIIAPKAFTWGWDIFYPNIAPLQHRWGRNYRRTVWQDSDMTPADRKSSKLYKQLLKMEPGFHNFGKFGLGSVRTIEEYQEYSGINFKQKTLTRKAKQGFPSY